MARKLASLTTSISRSARSNSSASYATIEPSRQSRFSKMQIAVTLALRAARPRARRTGPRGARSRRSVQARSVASARRCAPVARSARAPRSCRAPPRAPLGPWNRGAPASSLRGTRRASSRTPGWRERGTAFAASRWSRRSSGANCRIFTAYSNAGRASDARRGGRAADRHDARDRAPARAADSAAAPRGRSGGAAVAC